ncbi:MAG: spore germination protein GerW family protein, partial [Oscillospiraceae bacterium]
TFGGGGGAGISMSPVAFLVVSASGDVKLLELSNGKNTADKMVNIVPDIIDKISDLFGKKEEKADETDQSK